MKTALFALVALTCFGQTAFDVPQAALVLDRVGSLRPLNGMSQNFVLGDPLRSDVVSLACSGAVCYYKTQASIVGPSGEVAAPAGAAFISIGKSGAALFYFPSNGQFAWYRDGSLRILDWTVSGTVLAIHAHGQGADIAISRPDGVWIVRHDGAIRKNLPPGVLAVLFAGEQVLYATADGLTLEHEDGSTLALGLADASTLRPLNERYVQVSTADTDYVMRLDPGHEELSLLPEPLEVAQ